MLDEPGLIAVIDQPWWDSGGMDRDVEDRRKPYLKACAKMFEAISSKLIIKKKKIPFKKALFHGLSFN